MRVLYFLLLISSFLSAQTPDTVAIHRPLLFGIHYFKCYKIWFGNYNRLSCSIITRQDHIITNDSSYYFKVYGYSGRLLLEGRKSPDQALCGEIKFYRKNGRIKRIIYIRTFDEGLYDTIAPTACDGGSPGGTWKYFDRKGRLRKTIQFSAEKVNGEYQYNATITRFDKNNRKICSVRKEHHPCYFPYKGPATHCNRWRKKNCIVSSLIAALSPS